MFLLRERDGSRGSTAQRFKLTPRLQGILRKRRELALIDLNPDLTDCSAYAEVFSLLT